jgi:hypothetical protein
VEVLIKLLISKAHATRTRAALSQNHSLNSVEDMAKELRGEIEEEEERNWRSFGALQKPNWVM